MSHEYSRRLIWSSYPPGRYIAFAGDIASSTREEKDGFSRYLSLFS